MRKTPAVQLHVVQMVAVAITVLRTAEQHAALTGAVATTVPKSVAD